MKNVDESTFFKEKMLIYEEKKLVVKICFVCHGNICRSVAAQYILQDLVNQRGISENFFIDSAATSTEEIGNPIYPPMKKTLQDMEIPIGEHRARQLKRPDYKCYDLLIGMDEENLYYMHQILGDDPDRKFHYLTEYTNHPDQKIEDPWYTRKFRLCAEEIREGCQGLLETLM